MPNLNNFVILYYSSNLTNLTSQRWHKNHFFVSIRIYISQKWLVRHSKQTTSLSHCLSVWKSSRHQLSHSVRLMVCSCSGASGKLILTHCSDDAMLRGGDREPGVCRHRKVCTCYSFGNWIFYCDELLVRVTVQVERRVSNDLRQGYQGCVCVVGVIPELNLTIWI